jgi:uncharacterized protein
MYYSPGVIVVDDTQDNQTKRSEALLPTPQSWLILLSSAVCSAQSETSRRCGFREGSMSNYDRSATIQRQGAGVAQAEYDLGLRNYMLGIYNHMSLGVGITALTAFVVSMLAFTVDPATGARGLTGFGMTLFASNLKYLIMLSPLAFIMVLSFGVSRMSYPALLGTFWAFAAVMGLSMGAIFGVFTSASIVQTFLVTAVAFAGLSLVGYTTKRDLSAMGKFMVMGLIGLVLASIVNMFLHSSGLQFAVNAIGVLVFAGLTAWDSQRLRQDYDVVSGNVAVMQKHMLMGALGMYLNFVNMFQFLLAFMGNRE